MRPPEVKNCCLRLKDVLLSEFKQQPGSKTEQFITALIRLN